ncbi:MAG TPA: pre-16S rRNA-processing nuclease YqgF [Armatimonadota bacterium]|nr:pre-16S rRNA-processing nuclease YqgF [Armatimonadota bacterium]
MTTVLAVDPGREKCGLALVTENGVLHKEVVPREDVPLIVAHLAAEHSVDKIIVGSGTGGSALAEELRASALSVELVDETLSSRRGKERFFEDNPPRGIRRLVPRGLLTPDRPYDDYVALILAEDYFNRF